MTREEAIKTLKENSCNICSFLAKDMESCSIAYCDNRAAIRTLEQEPCEDCVSREELKKWLDMNFSFGGALRKLELFDRLDKELPSVIPKGVTVTDFADKCRECGKMRITCKTVTLTPFEIKMMQMSLYHQWFRMTDDNGEAINCEQKSADCVFDLMNRFEKLRAEVEQEEKE